MGKCCFPCSPYRHWSYWTKNQLKKIGNFVFVILADMERSYGVIQPTPPTAIPRYHGFMALFCPCQPHIRVFPSKEPYFILIYRQNILIKMILIKYMFHTIGTNGCLKKIENKRSFT